MGRRLAIALAIGLVCRAAALAAKPSKPPGGGDPPGNNGGGVIYFNSSSPLSRPTRCGSATLRPESPMPYSPNRGPTGSARRDGRLPVAKQRGQKLTRTPRANKTTSLA